MGDNLSVNFLPDIIPDFSWPAFSFGNGSDQNVSYFKFEEQTPLLLLQDKQASSQSAWSIFSSSALNELGIANFEQIKSTLTTQAGYSAAFTLLPGVAKLAAIPMGVMFIGDTFSKIREVFNDDKNKKWAALAALTVLGIYALFPSLTSAMKRPHRSPNNLNYLKGLYMPGSGTYNATLALTQRRNEFSKDKQLLTDLIEMAALHSKWKRKEGHPLNKSIPLNNVNEAKQALEATVVHNLANELNPDAATRFKSAGNFSEQGIRNLLMEGVIEPIQAAALLNPGMIQPRYRRDATDGSRIYSPESHLGPHSPLSDLVSAAKSVLTMQDRDKVDNAKNRVRAWNESQGRVVNPITHLAGHGENATAHILTNHGLVSASTRRNERNIHFPQRNHNNEDGWVISEGSDGTLRIVLTDGATGGNGSIAATVATETADSVLAKGGNADNVNKVMWDSHAALKRYRETYATFVGGEIFNRGHSKFLQYHLFGDSIIIVVRKGNVILRTLRQNHFLGADDLNIFKYGTHTLEKGDLVIFASDGIIPPGLSDDIIVGAIPTGVDGTLSNLGPDFTPASVFIGRLKKENLVEEAMDDKTAILFQVS